MTVRYRFEVWHNHTLIQGGEHANAMVAMQMMFDVVTEEVEGNALNFGVLDIKLYPTTGS